MNIADINTFNLSFYIDPLLRPFEGENYAFKIFHKKLELGMLVA